MAFFPGFVFEGILNSNRRVGTKSGIFFEITITPEENARSRIRTGELLRDRVLSPAPLTKLGNPRTIVLLLFLRVVREI
jgi:hypothetical protein